MHQSDSFLGRERCRQHWERPCNLWASSSSDMEATYAKKSEIGPCSSLCTRIIVRTPLAITDLYLRRTSVCITSIFRVTTLQPSSTSPDQIYGTLISTIWTTIEANTGIICACLPMLKKPLTMLFPRLFPRGSYHSAGYLPSNNATTPRRNSKFIWRTGWFRLGRDRRSTPAISPPVGFDPPPRDTFRDDTPESFLFSLGQNATPLQAMPSGRITRTTDVEVQFGAGADERVSSSESSAAPIKKDPGFPRAHLGGRNRMFR